MKKTETQKKDYLTISDLVKRHMEPSDMLTALYFCDRHISELENDFDFAVRLMITFAATTGALLGVVIFLAYRLIGG